MNDKKEILAVGSLAFDSLQTPNGNRDRILGGLCTYFSIAASFFSKTSIIGIVGNDFSKSEWELFDKYNINYESVEIAKGDRLDAILQKMVLWMTQNGTPSCSTLIDNHSPLYVNVNGVSTFINTSN